jgi:selenide,water dikinase
VQRIVAGGHAVCEAAGVPIAGGHSVDTPEPLYGLVALGLMDPRKVKRVESATRLNTPGVRLAEMEGVHAMTDITGYGLLGHLLEICRGSKLAAQVAFDALPVLTAARHLAEAGYSTGASDRNWTSFGAQVELPADWPAWRRKLLTDPQTSGGLLVACDAATAPAVLDLFKAEGFGHAAQIGTLEAGAPRVVVA